MKSAALSLPSFVQKEVEKIAKMEAASAWEAAVEHKRIQPLLTESLSNIVKRSSFSQSSKGIVTAGVSKSIQYVLKKVLKRFRA